MAINDPVDGFHGERSTNNHGGTCPFCNEGFDATLANHLEFHCGSIPEFEWDREMEND